MCQPARCSPHGVSAVIGNFRWVPELAQSIWRIRQGPKPSLTDEETGCLRGYRTSYGFFGSKLEVGPTPTFPPHDTALCLFKCDPIRGGLSEIIVQILYIFELVKGFTAYSGAHNHLCRERSLGRTEIPLAMLSAFHLFCLS